MHDPLGKALWLVERHFGADLTLEQIASQVGVSRHYLTRAFAATTGLSIMRYVRGRRLTEAARALVDGAPDILSVALDAGYGSHEAFTRAFREQFGCTPEAIREQRALKGISLVEAIKMNETIHTDLPPPRFETGKALLLTGIAERYVCETSAGIPAQWQRFLPHFGHVPGQIGRTAYGVCYNADDNGDFDYLCGVEVPDFTRVPEGWARLRIGEHRYAVFEHRQHISEIRRTWNTIWSRWLPSSGHELADAPYFELYPPTFDSQTGNGGLELWVPLK
jgi:AraC family transcriptional regulator